MVVAVKRGQVVAMAAAKAGVLFKQTLLQVVAQRFGLVVVKAFLNLAHRELVDLAVGIQHVVQRFALEFGRFGQQVGRPDFFHLEALGKLDVLPQIALGLTRCAHLLPPELGAPLGIAKGTFFFAPHGRGQNQIRCHGADGGVGI